MEEYVGELERERAQAAAEQSSLKAALEAVEGNSDRVIELEAQLEAAKAMVEESQRHLEEALNSKTEELEILEQELSKRNDEIKAL